MSEILFEYTRQGQYVKVCAIETETATEVSIVVPLGLSQQQMQVQALQKLRYVLQKKEREDAE